jgi:glycosyltransferase involved in cell wall biosynthesis
MISVCIPIYNFNVSDLVLELSRQAKPLQEAVEIILIDDASSEQYRKQNEETCSRHHYIRLNRNIGRARIRNLFLEHARHPYLLFLDCDSRIISPAFLSDYMAELNQKAPRVICGGRVFPGERPGRERMLRWRYGTEREALSVQDREKDPGRSFMTNNFLVERTTLEKVRFDERIRQYGHEDTLFGFRLKQLGIKVRHIHNPVLNGELETNRTYLAKSRMAVENLVQILRMVEDPEAFSADVTLLDFHRRLKRKGLEGPARFLFFLTGPLLRALLTGGVASLRLFDFYRLGILMKGLKERSKGQAKER